MANRFMTGFDDHDAAGLLYEWAVPNTDRATIVAGRTGNCLRLTGVYDNPLCGLVFKTAAPEGQATCSLGFAFKVSSPGTLLTIGCSTTCHLQIRINPDGTINVARSGQPAAVWNSYLTFLDTNLGQSSNTYNSGIWNTLGITATIHDSTGSVTIVLNGITTVLSNKDTRNDGTASITYFGFGCLGDGRQIEIDDVYFNDSTGSVCNGYLGDQRVDFHLPNANGATSGWTPSTGLDNYATIDENPQSITDYNSTITLNALDTLGIEDFKNNGADIEAIQINMLAQKADAGVCGIAAVTRESGVDTVLTTLYPSTNWAFLAENLSLAIGDAKRSAAGFNATEVGYKKVA